MLNPLVRSFRKHPSPLSPGHSSSLPTASQHRRGGAKQRARAGPTHGWMAHGWTELASSGIRSQENTPRVVVVFLLWGYCLRTSETGQLPGGIQWLSMALPLAPSLPTGILLLLFRFSESLIDTEYLAETSSNKPCLSPGISGTLKFLVQRNAVGEGAKQLGSRLRTLSPAWS